MKPGRKAFKVLEGFMPTATDRQDYETLARTFSNHAICDLQKFGLSRGQAIAMIDPKHGSRCPGLSLRDNGL